MEILREVVVDLFLNFFQGVFFDELCRKLNLNPEEDSERG